MCENHGACSLCGIHRKMHIQLTFPYLLTDHSKKKCKEKLNILYDINTKQIILSMLLSYPNLLLRIYIHYSKY